MKRALRRRGPGWLTLFGLVVCLFACGAHQVPQEACADVLPKSCPSPQPSYSASVAPIIAARCISCHGPGGQSAYMPLGDYNALFSERQEVLQVIEQCVMPPSGAQQPNDLEREIVLGWLVCGAPNN